MKSHVLACLLGISAAVGVLAQPLDQHRSNLAKRGGPLGDINMWLNSPFGARLREEMDSDPRSRVHWDEEEKKLVDGNQQAVQEMQSLNPSHLKAVKGHFSLLDGTFAWPKLTQQQILALDSLQLPPMNRLMHHDQDTDKWFSGDGKALPQMEVHDVNMWMVDHDAYFLYDESIFVFDIPSNM